MLISQDIVDSKYLTATSQQQQHFPNETESDKRRQHHLPFEMRVSVCGAYASKYGYFGIYSTVFINMVQIEQQTVFYVKS